MGAESPRRPGFKSGEDSAIQESKILVPRGDECLEAIGFAGVGAVRAGPMKELLQELNRVGIRYLLIGGQAMRLAGMPRFSMDWDFFIPPRDTENFARLNQVLEAELDMPVIPLGKGGENFIQTYQTRWGIIQFHLGLPGVPRFDEADQSAVIRATEDGTPVRCLAGVHLLASKQAANRPQDQADIEFLLELQRLGKLT